MTLPAHLLTEVGWWLGYAERHPDFESTPYWASRFALEVLADKSLATRLSCINALGEYHVKYLNRPNPFAANPWPYPLLKRFLPMDWAAVAAWLGGLDGPERAWAALICLARASAEDCMTWRPESNLRGNAVLLNGRVVPVTDTAVQWLKAWVKPAKARDVTAVLPLGVKLTDLHSALFLELQRRGVPEVTVAGVYGRWSAMSLGVADSPVTYFRVPILTGGGS